ncbi:NrsF family protein [Methylovirgula sp. 4M-Z18]|uniref:NrsF family protein n=1 Tax=Methylovirgula sp. 4M-Z18 TaxID=2293567 RepID=UPI000E2EE334|nr:NrsF family protein [Methylovirgula sp. 4M-Z18]RFB75594.1 DUF1109 family protein [Methylovirgula sp. 4M-Z18]
MKTEEFINLLAADSSRQWRFRSILATAVGGGIVLAGALFFAGIGFRQDIAQALKSAHFLYKFVVTIALAITATLAMAQLSRPGALVAGRMRSLAIVPALLLGGVIFELVTVPEDQWTVRLMGHNARLCLSLLPLLAIGPLGCLLVALRQGAPTNPGLAGAVAGLAASGIGATFYAAHCDDDSPLFVITWYSIAVLIVTLAGYVIGKKALRW